jgi:glycosyltransferase involved in cell wall biosynthesis
MEQNKIYLSVIIPAYNEAERIGATLKRTDEYLKGKIFSSEIIVVVDGAKDKTAEVAQALVGAIPNLRVIDRKENRGKGYTVREGMLAARGEVRLFTDADNSTDIKHFDLMKPLFDGGADVVIASRDKKDAPGARQSVSQSGLKRLLGNMGNLFIQIVAVRGIWDTQCGFKAFRAVAAEKIFSHSRIDRWGFDIEALALAKHFDLKLTIVPADWKNDPRSHVSMAAYFQVLWETTKIGWWLMIGKYNGS